MTEYLKNKLDFQFLQQGSIILIDVLITTKDISFSVIILIARSSNDKSAYI